MIGNYLNCAQLSRGDTHDKWKCVKSAQRNKNIKKDQNKILEIKKIQLTKQNIHSLA